MPTLKATGLATAFAPAGVVGETYIRLARAAHRVRVLIGVSALATAWTLPGATTRQRITFVALVGLLYLPYSVVLLAVAKRWDTRAVRVAGVAGDLLIVFLFQVLLPPTRLVALFGYLLIVGFHAFLGGAVAGGLVAAAGLGLTLVAERVFPGPHPLSPYEVTMYGAVLASLAALLHAANREQRRAALELQEEIVERQQLEGVLRERESQLREAQALAHVGSWHWDARTGAVSWSEELHRIYGTSPALTTMTPESYLATVHPDDRAGVEAVIRTALENGEAFSAEHRVLRPDGGVRWVHGRGEVEMGEAGPIRMYGTGQDISERKELEVARERFIANAAHELRTPLTSLAGFAATLAVRWRHLTEAQLDEYLGIMDRQGARAAKLIADLLDLSRLGGGKLELDLQPVNLAAAATLALEVAPPPEDKAVEIDVPETLVVIADPLRLEEILINLLTNAYRYGGPGVRLDATGADEGVVVRVSDDGDGVPDALVPFLFEPFARGDNAHGVQGSGLGLAIVRSLVEALDGCLSYVPMRPHGARFLIHLGRATTDSTEATSPQTLGTNRSDSPIPPTVVPLERPAAARP